MAVNAKSSIISWWILALMSLFLWYRNENYDRALAVFVFTLGLVQLIEYGIHSGADPNQSGRTLFVILWIQCLVLAIGVFVLIQDTRDPDHLSTTQNIVSTIAGWNLFVFGVIFIIAFVSIFISGNNFQATPQEWTLNGESILEKWGWLYGLGIFIPLILLFAYYAWADVGIAILIIYAVLAVAFILTRPLNLLHLWSYISVGFAFLIWVLGILPTSTETKNIIQV